MQKLPSKTPLSQAHPSHIQTLRTTAPQEHETTLCGHFTDIEVHDLVPRPELHVRHAHRPLVLLQRRLDEDHVELAIEVLKVIIHEITLQVHGGSGGLLDEVVLEFDELAELGVLLETIGQTHVADEVLRPLSCVDEMLAVVIVRVR